MFERRFGEGLREDGAKEYWSKRTDANSVACRAVVREVAGVLLTDYQCHAAKNIYPLEIIVLSTKLCNVINRNLPECGRNWCKSRPSQRQPAYTYLLRYEPQYIEEIGVLNKDIVAMSMRDTTYVASEEVVRDRRFKNNHLCTQERGVDDYFHHQFIRLLHALTSLPSHKPCECVIEHCTSKTKNGSYTLLVRFDVPLKHSK